MQGVWGLLVSRYSQTEDVVFGTIVSGRPGELRGIEEMIGLFINTIPVRVRIREEGTVRELLEEVQREAIAGMPHHYTQLAQVQAQTPLGRNLFDHILIFENYPVQEIVEKDIQDAADQLTLLSSEVFERTNYDLSVIIVPGETIRIQFDYNAEVYDQQLIRDAGEMLLLLITQVLDNPVCRQLDPITPAQRHQLLTVFNGRKVEEPAGMTVLDLFYRQVEQYPERPALVSGGAVMTYRQLDEEAARLAAWLQHEREIRQGDRVGILLDRSEWMIVAIFGVLRSGAAYVPVDPEYPADRINYVLSDSECKVVIDGPALAQGRAYMPAAREYDSRDAVHPAGSAYVIYTSGSTGQPKGVMIRHDNLFHSTWQRTRIYRPVTSFLLMSSIAFDSSVAGIFGTLCTGGALCIPLAGGAADTEYIAALIAEQGVSHLLCVPSYYQWLIPALKDRGHRLQQVIVAGESCPPQLVEQHFSDPSLQQAHLFNEYGPTECSVWSTYYQYDPANILSTIGRPLDNTILYILGRNKELLPAGAAGEIAIGGRGLAEGYLHRPELTSEKFVADPFVPGDKIYLTGDLGRWLPDGNIEFLGRKDHQVKIRGYRIELGEIENTLLTHPSIQSAVVMARTNVLGEKELVAWLVSEGELSMPDIRSYLSGILPSYMLPAHLVRLESMPLSPNGKVDRNRLPDPEDLSSDGATPYVKPRTTTEERLAAIWAQLLGRPYIGARDDFFEAGGHSLKATRLVSQIHREFGVKLALKDLFVETVLEDQARLIDEARKVSFIEIAQAFPQENYPLSSAQRRLWVACQSPEVNRAYNIPGIFVLEGILDTVALEKAFSALIHRHESLRTVFRDKGEGEVRQYILQLANAGFQLTILDIRGDEQRQSLCRIHAENLLSTPMDLAHGPLLRASVQRLEDQTWILTYVMHHILSDGWSMNILMKELMILYNAYTAGQDSPLEPLRIQYKDYAVWEQEQLSGEMLAAHRQYWLQQMEGDLPVLRFPADKPRPSIKTYNGASVSRRLYAQLTSGIRALSGEQGATLFMGLVAAVNALLYRYTSQNDIIVGSPIAGRQHPDLEDQIGFYINTLPLRTRFTGEDSFRTLLDIVRDMTLEAYEHQLYPFDELVENLHLRRDRSRNPLFDVWVVLQSSEGGSKLEEEDTLEGLKVSAYEGIEKISCRYDLLFNFVEIGDELHVGIIYNTDVYTGQTVEKLSSHLEKLLYAAIAAPDVSIGHLNIVQEDEKSFLLATGTSILSNPHSDASVVTLFEQQAEKTPDNIALVSGPRKITYRDLNRLVNRLAGWLRARYGAGAGDIVAINLDRDERMIVALLGILKTGAAYVPIDPDYPGDRKTYMVTDCRCKVVIDADLWQSFEEEKKQYPAYNPAHQAGPDDLAYVIYTSGSTGRPKGVMIRHRSLVDYYYGILERTNMASCRSFGLVSTLAADLGNTVLYTSLLSGGELHVFSAKEVMSAESMSRVEVDCVKIVPSHWKALQGESTTFAPRHCLVFGGEQLTPDVLAIIRQKGLSCEVYNHYGPTETTIGKLCRRIDPWHTDGKISLGLPFGNTRVYILDEYGSMAPHGVPGEIHIGGEGLAAGYLNNPGLTKEKFISDPYKPGSLIYRTGDIGRMLSDGAVEFIGRRDGQLKIRGFRVEPGEIEEALSQYPGIQSCLVLAREEGGDKKILVAWFIAQKDFDESALSSYMNGRLPAYMLPAHYIRLDQWPLTANGKIDRSALPAPGLSSSARTGHRLAPRNAAEEKMTAIWAEVLELDQAEIGVTDNFFDLGGHSLKAIRILLRIHEQYGVEINLGNFFVNPTVESAVIEVENILWVKNNGEMISATDKTVI
jgi:amino acid adenylation domain-containing protein